MINRKHEVLEIKENQTRRKAGKLRGRDSRPDRNGRSSLRRDVLGFGKALKNWDFIEASDVGLDYLFGQAQTEYTAQ